MSFVFANPESLASAASDLANIGSTLTAANAAAAPATNVLAAAQDEVSVQIAAFFGANAREYQAISAQAAAFHERFVQALIAGAGGYAVTEAANASPLQTLEQDVLGLINAPSNALFGRPLIANGTTGRREPARPAGPPGS